MNWLTFLPAAVTTALALALGRWPLPLHPLWEARLLATVALTTLLAVVGTFVFIGVNYLAGLMPWAAGVLPEWALFGDEEPLRTGAGVPSLLLSCVCLAAACRLAARSAAEVRAARRSSGSLMDTDLPIAVAVPGRGGGVLVSRGLLDRLTAAELQVVFLHERSHLRHRHHRYLALGALAAGVLPPLRRMNQRLRFSLERWADEDAAEAVGDRPLVARTIARVALTSPAASPLPAFSESGVVGRVKALLGTPPSKNPVTGPMVVFSTGLTTSCLASTALQLDRALGFTFL